MLVDNAKKALASCPVTLRDSRIYDVASAVRVSSGSTVEGNFILANRYGDGSDTVAGLRLGGRRLGGHRRAGWWLMTTPRRRP